MDRTMVYVNLASDVRWCWERLASVSNRLVEMHRGALAAQSTDLELKLLALHNELLELALDAPTSARREQSARGQDDAVPF